MKDKKSFFEKISTGRGFYVTATICVCVIISAVALIYNSSLKMIRDVVPEVTTAEVQKNQRGVSDPRSTTVKPTGGRETTTKKSEPTTERTTNEPSRVITTAEATKPTFTKSESFILPVPGEIIKPFSISPVYDKTMGDWRSHGGVDFRTAEDEDVKAVGNGRVSKVISDPSWGYILEIDCGDFTVRYCGLQQGTTLKINTLVSSGDIIGKVGAIPTESAEESHLHLEVIKDGDRINPHIIFEAAE